MRGVHGVDPNHVLPQLDCEGPHEAHDAVLGGNVVTAMRVGLQPAHRAGQDDRPAFAARDDVRDTGFHRLPHPRQVDVDHLRPVFFAGLVQRVAAVADACVGHDDVQPAQLLDAAVHGGLQGVVVTHVDFGRVDPAIMALDEVGGLGQILGRRCRNRGVLHDRLTDVDGDDVGALLRQPHRVATALTARRPGDESDFALNTSTPWLTSIPYLIRPARLSGERPALSPNPARWTSGKACTRQCRRPIRGSASRSPRARSGPPGAPAPSRGSNGCRH